MKGKDLEEKGKNILESLGFHVDYNLNDARLIKLDPDGSYEEDEHLELDYLIPANNVVLIGEITGRSTSTSAVKEKLSRFADHINTFRNCNYDGDFWSRIGVPEENIHLYLGIKNVKCFFITNQYNEYEIQLPNINNIVNIYNNNWKTLETYSDIIGVYGRRHFLEKMGVEDKVGTKKRLVLGENDCLTAQRYRKISGNVDSFAHLYRFDISPYEILPITRVARRDNFPSLPEQESEDYQRPLREEKIKSIRKILTNNNNFLFPNNILCVLSDGCEYSESTEELSIPYRYGSITVIDGQHRLYSYANQKIKALLSNPLVPVAAVQFEGADEQKINTHSAYIFLEINANQTRIKPKYLDAISYDILGETEPKALASKILKESNEAEDECLYGLFDIYKGGEGFFEVGTIRNKLSQITNTSKTENLTNAESGDRLDRKIGYENLFSEDINALSDAENMVSSGEVVVRRYFGTVERRFRNDWPDITQTQSGQSSALSLAKSFAGLVRLLQHFIEQGYEWDGVEQSIHSMRSNLLTLRGLDEKDENIPPLLDTSDQAIPDSSTSTMDFYRFFLENIESPTPISEASN